MQSSNENNPYFVDRKQGRTWFLTINCQNGEEEFEKAKMHCLFVTGQVEVGSKTGREHIHMVIHFDKNWRFKRVKKIWPRADIEVPRSVENCIKYV